ncbi:CCR4-NOT transcription complex subunit 9-like [Aethina tumida]|uniref:CCR4-NOT transcription complex subunit 9-like n=1 Tax=Aethina tumida TaxID=116153 RepID=UPI00214871D9|nr:CCR4-NOT transcription complex subunit 9-like [Aethina tumida]
MYLYHTHGVYDIIISEITKIYPALADGTLNLTLASNAHYALQLLEVIVTNRRLQEKFLEGNKPECVYQIFMREPTTKFEGLLRRDCLKVLDALALHTGLPVSKFFIDTKYLTLCVTLLKSKDLGEVETALRTLKTFLHSPVGPDHVNENELTLPWILEALSCATTTVLKKSEAGTISTIIMCYLKLAEDQRSILYLPQMVHEDIWNGKLDNIIECHLKQFRRYLLIKVGHADSL